MSRLEKQSKKLSQALVESCIDKGLHLVAAESMTGGLLISLLTETPGASLIIDRSFIVYSDQAKSEILNVSQSVIKKHSVYSIEVIREMISGLNLLSNAEIKIAISGIASPIPGSDKCPGSVYIGIDISGKMTTYQKHFKGSRTDIRYQTVIFIFQELLNLI